LEENPQTRIGCMTNSNRWIAANGKDLVHPTEVARGSLFPVEESALFLCMLRFGASLMIAPDIEEEQTHIANVTSGDMRGSAFIFDLVTGFGTMPENLTEEAAEQSEA
jgi:hypothetical protein